MFSKWNLINWNVISWFIHSNQRLDLYLDLSISISLYKVFKTFFCYLKVRCGETCGLAVVFRSTLGHIKGSRHWFIFKTMTLIRFIHRIVPFIALLFLEVRNQPIARVTPASILSYSVSLIHNEQQHGSAEHILHKEKSSGGHKTIIWHISMWFCSSLCRPHPLTGHLDNHVHTYYNTRNHQVSHNM